MFIRSLLILFTLGIVTTLSAQAPMLINYQGKLTHPDGTPITDDKAITFSIYSDTSSSSIALWDEIQVVSFSKNGVFHVLLGSSDSIPNNLFSSNQKIYLGIKIGNNPEISPRHRLTSVPYAMHSQSANILSASDGDPLDAVIVDAEGNVKIGTNTPQSLLDVGGGDGGFGWAGDHSDSGFVRIGDLQICWGHYRIEPEDQFWNTGEFVAYATVSDTIYFSELFKNAPIISLSLRDPYSGARSSYVSNFYSRNYGVIGIRLSSPSSNPNINQYVRIYWIAIGQWR